MTIHSLQFYATQLDLFEIRVATRDERVLCNYIPGITTIREVARLSGVSNHLVKRILIKAGVTIVPGKLPPFTIEHRRKISKRTKGRKCWSTGLKMPRQTVIKNMAAHLRVDIDWKWLNQFQDIEKLKSLNRCVSRTREFPNITVQFYMEFISKFYDDEQFNRVYERWCDAGKSDRYLRPSADHIVPISRGGEINSVANLQILTWFENRCKNAMTQKEWDRIKASIYDYIS
ncbi:HNH endonuclease signature motif containing protein [Mesorhizobium sp. M1B.F.Ca.ET.045.04.1.1]|uniref:HNH endonuclease signature motif containing protein n=1 Tax=Mesorhizobium sp. M1B.F.Ca.ET.045.04.1.1 TaxID=2493673 RepID=UPI000F759FF1|nr:HNH endonuclease signature motif containing protein [Mesorhizobium sp. M1B.F.Ca.ET.045.04.1.1]AZO29343.1 HNH endonuclease [Mesorhizobium sp. M1B.F.Ca.ET.045.04.1.1]